MKQYPFPGMNPYLEQRVIWEGVHARLIPIIANQIQPQLDPRYVTAVEERIFIEGPQERIPDVWIEETGDNRPLSVAQPKTDGTALIVEVDDLEIHEKRVEILDTHDDMKLVGVIGLVSPSNKRNGPGRNAYLKKQKSLWSKRCHLIEIDLLRNGAHVLAVPEWRVEYEGMYDYLVCASRWPNRHRFEVYPWTLRQRSPNVKIPLIEPDPDVTLDLQAALEQLYDEGRYGIRLKYDLPCKPKLSETDQAWVFEQLGKHLESGTAPNHSKATNGKKKKR